jgi:hypothetical protein
MSIKLIITTLLLLPALLFAFGEKPTAKDQIIPTVNGVITPGRGTLSIAYYHNSEVIANSTLFTQPMHIETTGTLPNGLIKSTNNATGNFELTIVQSFENNTASGNMLWYLGGVLREKLPFRNNYANGLKEIYDASGAITMTRNIIEGIEATPNTTSN